jgi:hypothetical protein
MTDKDKAIEDEIQRRCPKCFHDQSETVTVNEIEKKRYIECILTNKVFSKDYKLFEGRLTIVMRSLSSADASRMSRLLQQLDADDSLFTENIHRIKILFYLQEYRDEVYPIPATETAEQALEVFKERFGELSEDVVGILIRTLMEFVRLLGHLVGSGFDKDFWQGVGLD